jgi:hypothetical protein
MALRQEIYPQWYAGRAIYSQWFPDSKGNIFTMVSRQQGQYIHNGMQASGQYIHNGILTARAIYSQWYAGIRVIYSQWYPGSRAVIFTMVSRQQGSSQ